MLRFYILNYEGGIFGWHPKNIEQRKERLQRSCLLDNISRSTLHVNVLLYVVGIV